MVSAISARLGTAAIIVALATVLVYIPALHNDFVNWDDHYYVYENQNIQSLGFLSLKWMFTAFHSGNWHPLTWLSHAVDYALWGLNPLGHHLTSVLLHGLNTFLVVLLITRLVSLARARASGDGQSPSPGSPWSQWRGCLKGRTCCMPCFIFSA
jgi:hypothetical protein